MLKIGDQAPDFTLPADNLEQISLKQFRGQKVILYFYPKDNTPGCTQEACDFRDSFPDFNQENAVILGISKDSSAAHQKFKAKYNLPFTLLTDAEAKVCIAYEVLNPKSMFGKTFLGIQRATFLIDEEGKIQALWPKVKVTGHAKAVFDELAKTTVN